MRLSDLYTDFVTVLCSAPHGSAVLSEKLLPLNSADVAVADILSAPSEVSIDEKLKQPGVYDQPYFFFHDLKLAFGRLIAQYPQNAPEYDEIASLFRFAVDLLIREADRLGFTSRVDPSHVQPLQQLPSQPQQQAEPDMTGLSDLSTAYANDFVAEFSGDAMGSPSLESASLSISSNFQQPGFPTTNTTSTTTNTNTNTATTSTTNTPTNNQLAINSGGANDDEYLFQISQGFQTISTEVQDWNGETYWITAANGPLFMSANNKAPIDPRDTAVSGSVHTVKLLPHFARGPESTLGFTSPLNQRFPQPNAPPTDLMSRFVHPNGHATFAPIWLAGQDVYSSFAPSSDSAGAVVGEEDAANVWESKATLTQDQQAARDKAAAASKARESKEVSEVPIQKEEPNEISPQPAEQLPSQQEPQQQQPQPPNQLMQAAGLPSQMHNFHLQQQQHLDNINSFMHSVPGLPRDPVEELSGEELEALLRWTPYNFVDDDEMEAAGQGKEAERQLVSKLLLELQFMQQQRLSAPGTELEISDIERHVAFKCANLLSRLVDGAKPEDIALKLDTRLPVLMRNYAGSLPAATDPFMHGPPQPFGGTGMPPQSQRLQTIAGLRSRARSRR